MRPSNMMENVSQGVIWCHPRFAYHADKVLLVFEHDPSTHLRFRSVVLVELLSLARKEFPLLWSGKGK
jgi:hypothetical protein